MEPFSALTFDFRGLRERKLRPLTVAVVDSGIDATHPALAGRVERAIRIEQHESGPEVVEGPVPENADLYGHGTGIAGIIAELAPNARLIDVRVLNAENLCTGETLVAGMKLAIEEKFKIVNMSLAARVAFRPALNSLCETAYRQNQLIVAARRNMPLVDDGFPAEIASCISVDRGRLSSLFSLVFREEGAIELAAKGEEVTIAAAGGGKTTVNGTSFATAVVTGLCALLLGAYPDLRPFDVKSLLRSFEER